MKTVSRCENLIHTEVYLSEKSFSGDEKCNTEIRKHKNAFKKLSKEIGNRTMLLEIKKTVINFNNINSTIWQRMIENNIEDSEKN